MSSTESQKRRAASAHRLTASLTARFTAQVSWCLAAALCALGLLASCSSGPSLEPDVPAGVSLAGPWKLNHQASADPNALIEAIVEKQMKHMRRHVSAEDEEDGPLDAPGEPGTSSGGRGMRGGRPETTDTPRGMFRPRGGMPAYIRSHYTNALGSILNGEGLVIEQAPDRFTIQRGDSRRTFTPGSRSVVGVADGVADQTSGWKGRDYVIDVRPQVGPHLSERYSLGSGGQLIEKISLSADDDLPKLEFTRVYDKGSAPGRVLPGS